MRILFLALSLLCAMMWASLAADQPPAEKAQPKAPPKAAPAPKAAPVADVAADGRAADEAAIRAAGKAFIDAYNARDAKKLAALWSPEAIYTDPLTGEQSIGRDEIEKAFDDAFSDKQEAKLEFDVGSIEFVSPNVAMIRGVARVIRPGEEPEESDFSAVRMKRDGQWLLDRVSEVEKDKPAPSNYEHLKELEWMIGSWHDDDPRPSVEIQSDCAWTKNKNFITRSFAVAIGDEVRKSGMQIIGWDPIAKHIRSWVFDSDGGYGEGTWTHKKEKWFIQNSATLQDGGKASGLNIITKLDDNSFKWESIHREIDGELQPNADPIVVVRKTDK